MYVERPGWSRAAAQLEAGLELTARAALSARGRGGPPCTASPRALPPHLPPAPAAGRAAAPRGGGGSQGGASGGARARGRGQASGVQPAAAPARQELPQPRPVSWAALGLAAADEQLSIACNIQRTRVLRRRRRPAPPITAPALYIVCTPLPRYLCPLSSCCCSSCQFCACPAVQSRAGAQAIQSTSCALRGCSGVSCRRTCDHCVHHRSRVFLAAPLSLRSQLLPVRATEPSPDMRVLGALALAAAVACLLFTCARLAGTVCMRQHGMRQHCRRYGA